MGKKRHTTGPGIFDAVLDYDEDGLFAGHQQHGPCPQIVFARSDFATRYPARPYQGNAVLSTLAELQCVHSTIIVSATGTGKTVIACHLIYRWVVQDQCRILFVVHREELVNQAVQKISEVLGSDYLVEAEIAERRATDPDNAFRKKADVVVASKDTLCTTARLERFPRDWFDYCITDECHHAVASNRSYQDIYDWFNVGGDVKDETGVLLPHVCKHVGVTAEPQTPGREGHASNF